MPSDRDGRIRQRRDREPFDFDDQPPARRRRRDDDGEQPARRSPVPLVFVFAAVGVLGALGLLALTIALVLRTAAPGASRPPQPAAAVAVPVQPPAPAAPDWFDASKKAARVGDVELKVAGVRCVKPMAWVEDFQGKSPEVEVTIPCLEVGVSVGNHSATIIHDFSPWVPFENIIGRIQSPAHSCSLRDNFGNVYEQLPAHHQGRVRGQYRPGRERLRPGEHINGTLIFEKPLPNAEWFQLDLDCGAIAGKSGVVRFRIPASMVRWEAK